jgi:hypothetical protein
LESEVYSEPKEFDEQKEGDNIDRIDVNFWKELLENVEGHELLKSIIEEREREEIAKLDKENHEQSVSDRKQQQILTGNSYAPSSDQDLFNRYEENGNVRTTSPKSMKDDQSIDSRSISSNTYSSKSRISQQMQKSKENLTLYAEIYKELEKSDPEKARLRYMVAALQEECQNCRLREQEAIHAAQVFESLLHKQIQYNKNLKKEYCAKEIEVVEMRAVIDELNGALQRANMAEQHKKSNRASLNPVSS